MKRILVGIDGSEPSLDALKLAGKLAKANDAGLELVYVRAPIMLPPQPYADVIDRIEKEELKAADEILAKAAKVAQSFGVEVRQASPMGAPAETIADLAEAEPVWMVAVGSRGQGAVKRVLLGSVADRVVHLCQKPVLVVR